MVPLAIEFPSLQDLMLPAHSYFLKQEGMLGLLDPDSCWTGFHSFQNASDLYCVLTPALVKSGPGQSTR